MPKWSDNINEEWIRNLLNNRKDIVRSRLENTVFHMNLAFKDANVEKYEKLIPKLSLPDLDDKHVLAVGIKSHADMIFTFNLKDFPKNILAKYNIEVEHPDDFFIKIIDHHQETFIKAFNNQVANLKNPPKTKSEVLITLEKCQLPRTTNKLREISIS